MDADFKEQRRKRISSQREKRWSMNSQRLEEIVAELMRPIGDLRHSFDTDLSALLEEYLTEAGLHALAAEEDEPAPAPNAPNFAELALLLQQSASIYGRKVDFLYQHVLSVSDSLNASTLEMANASAEEEPAAARRKRRASAAPADFAHVALEAGGGAAREPEPPRPPPTLPRMYIELEPRVLAPGDAPLADYAGEPVGLLADFHVAWRLQDGLLVDELEGAATRGAALRAIPLTELQAAIEANAPSPPPPCRHEDSPPPESPPPPPSPAASPPPVAEPACRRDRKRRSDGALDDMPGKGFKLHVTKELRRLLRTVREFSPEPAWVSAAVRSRSLRVLELRRGLRAQWPACGFEGFEYSSRDVSGFPGWTGEEGPAAAAAAELARGQLQRPDESDDDGFFEQSSLGDSDTSRHDDCPLALSTLGSPSAEWEAWRAGVCARAAAGERRGLDVRAAAQRLLPHLAAERATPFARLLGDVAKDDLDVSRVFLTTLFLANAGNVEVVPGAPLSLNSFSVRLASADPSLYLAAVHSHEDAAR